MMNVLSSALFLQVPEWLLEYWHPSEKAMYPDYFSKREQWKQLRMQSWDKEVGSSGHGFKISRYQSFPPGGAKVKLLQPQFESPSQN